MRKHTKRISEISFAESLEEGEKFAISDTTYFPTIQSTLKTQKNLNAVLVPVRELSQKEKRHWHVYRVVPDRDPTSLVERDRLRREARMMDSYSPYLSRSEAALIGYEKEWLTDWEKRHGTSG